MYAQWRWVACVFELSNLPMESRVFLISLLHTIQHWQRHMPSFYDQCSRKVPFRILIAVVLGVSCICIWVWTVNVMPGYRRPTSNAKHLLYSPIKKQQKYKKNHYFPTHPNCNLIYEIFQIKQKSPSTFCHDVASILSKRFKPFCPITGIFSLPGLVPRVHTGE